MTRRRDEVSPAVQALLLPWHQHVAGTDAELPEPLLAAIGQASPGEGSQFLASLAREARQLRAAIAQQQQALGEAVQQIEALTAPPLPVARLVTVDRQRRRAWVATSPQQSFEVGIDHRLDVETLQRGQDVVLSEQRTAVLRPLASQGEPLGQERVCELRSWLEAPPASPAEPGRLYWALAAEGGHELLVGVPAAVADRVAAERWPPRLLVDLFGQARGVAGTTGADPAQRASRFELALEPRDEASIVGLEPQRQRVREAVARVASRGAFLVCEGPPGSGKSLLAGYALHLLRAQGETTVLSLRPAADWRYYGQVEADVEELMKSAEALAGTGRQVVIFLDEIDTQFFTSRFGHSVHDNATRGTWLRLLGGETDLRGILVYATTNKAAHLPDELLNRATQIVSFEAPGREQARGLLDMYLAAKALGGAARAALLQAVVDFLYDDGDRNAVARVTLRDRSEHALHPRDLRQLSARFFKELAWRIDAVAAEREVGPGIDLALSVTAERLDELVRGVSLTAENLAERTFCVLDPRNPADSVRLLPLRQAEALAYRYEPVELLR